MSRRILAILVLTTALAVPAGASAGDKTLLSGYGGPGGGEQSALGSQLLPPPSGNGSLKAANPRGAAAAVTPPAPAVGGSVPGREQRPDSGAGRPGADRAAGTAAGKTATGGRRDGGTRADSGRDQGPGGAAKPTRSATARVQPVSYPPGATAGALPISTSDALLLLLGLAAVMLVGAATRSLVHRAGAPESGTDI